MNPFCCHALEQLCIEEEYPIHYNPKLREFGLDILDGGSSIQLISFCPCCGKQLPRSLRNDWFQAVEDAGFDPIESVDIPQEFNSDEWWQKK